MDVLVRRNSSFSGIDSIRTYSTALYLLTVLKVAKRTENFFFMLFKYIYAGKPYFLNFRCTSTTWRPPSCTTSRSRPGRDRRSGRRSCTLGGSPTRGEGKSHKKLQKRKIKGKCCATCMFFALFRRRILLQPGCEAMRTFSPRWEPIIFCPLSPCLVATA